MPSYEFRQCVERYNGNYKVKTFSCRDQFLCMAFAQLTYRESLRVIEACLRVAKTKLYHMGIRGKVSRNTLAHANETRDWKIYADFAQVDRTPENSTPAKIWPELTRQFMPRRLSTSAFGVHSKVSHQQGRGETPYSVRLARQHPVIISITHGKVHDVNILTNCYRGWRNHIRSCI
jgi:hypothetical protein